MKKLFFTAIAAVMALSMSAESDIFEGNNAPYFGARVGVDISSSSNSYDDFSNGAGFSLGAVYNIPVYKNLYVEPGLSIFYDTFGTETILLNDDMAERSIDGSIRNFGFRIPIVAGYFFDFTDDIRIAPFTGPQLNVSLTAKSKIGDDDAKSIFGQGGFKHADIQWVFGVGMTYQQYYVAISGAIGMTKIYDLAVYHFNRNVVSIAVGYNF